MADTLTREQRSRCMAAVKCQHTRPEVALRRALWRLGFRYRLTSALVGKPDLVLPRRQTAIFVDGCFWHGCPKHCRLPATNVTYWTGKIARNQRRDRRVAKELRRLGWRVLRVWEHDIKRNPERAAAKLAGRILKPSAAKPKGRKRT